MNDAVAKAMQTEFTKFDVKRAFDEVLAELRRASCVAIFDGGSFLGLITRADVLSYLRRRG